MIKFLLWCILFVLCWPLALMALVLYPFVWLILLPFRLVGIAVGGAGSVHCAGECLRRPAGRQQRAFTVLSRLPGCKRKGNRTVGTGAPLRRL